MAKGKKTGGRKKGTQNKVTALTKEIIADLTSKLQPMIMEDIEALDPKDRVAANIKLAEFVVPKPQRLDISLEGDNTITIEDKLLKLSRENDK